MKTALVVIDVQMALAHDDANATKIYGPST